jgi:hypothetical protein
MEPNPHPHSVQQYPPVEPHPEPREETVARVLDEAGELQRGQAREQLADPSTRRGVNRALVKTALVAAAAGFVAGALIALILSLVSGPFETSGWGDTIGYMVAIGAALALVVGMLASLALLAREDGRVEREVERRTGRTGDEPGPGSPGDPRYDVEDR